MPEEPTNPPPDLHRPEVRDSLNRYWGANVRVMSLLLLVWALAGLGCGVLFADKLNAFRMGGFPLGFWFAQQGSIVVFVIIILIYCLYMNRLDDKHHAELKALNHREGQ